MRLLNRGPWLVLLAALLAAALTARLGVWQLDRAGQKLALQARIDGRAAMPPLPAAELARSAATAGEQHYRHTLLRGQWLARHTVFLDNRQMNGRPGFYVLTPLLLADGDAVLVQRGWVPRHPHDRSALPPLATPAGPVLVAGRIAPPPAKLFELGAADSGRIRQNVDLDAFAREAGIALRPLSLQQTEAGPAWGAPASSSSHSSTPSSAANDGLLRQWPVVAVDVGKHHGYAFQWFALCALITGLYVWFQILRPRRR
ncbi:SURF1 family protein [Aquabacterium sp. OR-4]|uniref:SURF1 family protein n=1 Tax=Aquabacterium sp. OR-4 TaxID=2978127 RepID=UPI0028C6BF23|nr:SURF1 family protein [Aquabacterium sp. OR-4]MDT7834450.1 SURF1 family protein [Aquabacterium sp. OR-4]